MHEPYFVLKYPDGAFVGIDTSSGGYPTATSSPNSISFWPEAGPARTYRDQFPELKLKLFQISFVEVDLREDEPCSIGFDNTGVGGWCITHQTWRCPFYKKDK